MIAALQNKHDGMKRDKQGAVELKTKLEVDRDKCMNELEKKKKTIEQKNTQIGLLQKEKDQLQEQVKEKEHDLYKYKFKIKDL